MKLRNELGDASISRRDMLRMAGATVAAATLASCAPQEQETQVPEPAGPEQVELTWLSHTYEPWNNALSAQAMQYMNEHSNVKIVYSYITPADLNSKIVTSLASGDPFDIMGVYGPWMPQLVNGENLAPAPQHVLEDLDANFPEVMKDAATYDGKVYAYVQHIGIPSPIINVDLYEEEGVAEPDTYDELIAAAGALDKKDEDGNWAQFGCTLPTTKGGSWNVICYSSILFSHGGEFLDEALSKAAFNSAAGIEAAEIYTHLAHTEAPDSAFELEKSAMEWTGPWAKSTYDEQAPDLNYKAIKPMEGPSARVMGSYVWFWAISSAATVAEQEAAWDFTGWLSAPEQYAAMYRTVGLFPITNELPEEFAEDAWAQAFNETLQYARVYYAKHEKWEQIDVAIGEEMERLVGGEVSAEEFAQNAEKKVNSILS